MLKSSNPENLFETDAEQATRERRAAKSSNKHGNPIRLKSKLLAAITDPRAPSSSILVAESAGSVRGVNVDDGQTTAVYRGPSAPVTCLAVGGEGSNTLFAGSWDKAIWSWDLESKAPGIKYVGHADFVKAVACATISGTHYLISGGADKVIIVWNADTGLRLQTLRAMYKPMLAVQDLAVDPVASSADEVCLVSASSDPHLRRWLVRPNGWDQVGDGVSGAPGTERWPIREHETGIYKLVFDRDGDDVDLWTSSADGTSKCLSRTKNFESEDTIHHGDHVRALALTDRWVITAGRDEDVKFWDRSTGNLFCSLEGHYDEVTDLVVLKNPQHQAVRVCSVSVDGTVRTWPVEEAVLRDLVKEQEASKKVVEEPEPTVGAGLTADEEAELAALMEDD